ncbi:unnamed protein product [Dicrocoelium dendriticum]|nr:unnamed protein product [Dicrocoelium dendriticum]
MQVLNLEEAKGILQDKPSLVIAVYDYWLNKRVQSRQPLLFTVRHERRDGGSNTDPYVAFRRRSEKMQTRKNRKNDEQSYEKMLLFREQMESLGEVLSRLVRRETVKEALVLSDKRCFELRYQLGDWDGSSVTEAESFARKPPRVVNSSADVHSLKDFTRKRSSRKRKLTQRALDLSSHTQSSEDVEKERVECSENWPFAFVRTPGCQYLKPRDVGHGDSTSTPAFTRSPHLRYALATVPSINSSSRHIYTGYLRRRLGRGGRVICDRLGAPFELASFLRSYDEKVSSPYSLQTTSPMHLTVKPFEAKDEVLLRRLRPVLMASHQCRPSFQWPVCAKPSDPPSFEPLHPHPWKLITNSHLNQWTCPALHLNSTPMSPVMKGKNTSDSPKIIPFNSDQAYPPVLGRPPTSSQSDHTIENHDLRDGTSRYVSKSDSSIVTPPSEDRKHALLPLADSNAVSTPRRVWRKLARPFDAINALQPSDFPRSRGGETPISNSNGLASRIFQSTDDTLLLGSPVLTSSKVCNMARDHTCSGPQLPTTNGVCPPQFCQLPI